LGIGTLRRGEWYRLEEEEIAALQEPAWELEFIRKRRRKLKQQKRRTYRPPSTFDDSQAKPRKPIKSRKRGNK